MAMFCIDCGADISYSSKRTTLCPACKSKHAAASRKANREKRRAAKVCQICGKSLAGLVGQRVYCTECRPYAHKEIEETQGERMARIDAKIAKEKARTEKVLDEIMHGKAYPRSRVDESVETTIDSRTGYTTSWRGMKIYGCKACDNKRKYYS